MKMLLTSDWRHYEPCAENEFRAKCNREPVYECLIKWAILANPIGAAIALREQLRAQVDS